MKVWQCGVVCGFIYNEVLRGLLACLPLCAGMTNLTIGGFT